MAGLHHSANGASGQQNHISQLQCPTCTSSDPPDACGSATATSTAMGKGGRCQYTMAARSSIFKPSPLHWQLSYRMLSALPMLLRYSQQLPAPSKCTAWHSNNKPALKPWMWLCCLTKLYLQRQLTAQTVDRRIIHSVHLHTVFDMTDDDAESTYQTLAFGKE